MKKANKFKLCVLIASYLMLIANIGNAQKLNEDYERILEEMIEQQLTENETEDFDQSEYAEFYKNYLYYPINLNKTTKQEFSELALLSELQLNAFF